MPTQLSSMSFDSYINKLYCNKGERFTHTRIADKKLSIKGGLYNVPEEKESEFISKYCTHVFQKGNAEYITERQLENAGPLAVDFDFRYDTSVAERQHTKEHIFDMINLYSEQLIDHLVIKHDVPIPVYIFEKNNVNCQEDKTKDGIHMIIGIHALRTLQMIISENVVSEIPSIWDDLPLTNNWSDVLDEGVSKGTTNWQLYGSKKPGNEAYKLKYVLELKYDSKEDGWTMKEENLSNFDIVKNFKQLSVRYSGHHHFELTDHAKELCDRHKSNKKSGGGRSIRIVQKTLIPYNEIRNEEMLDEAIELLMESLESKDYEIKETHYYTMCLGSNYFDPYNNWIRVMFALRNTDPRLFLTWIKLSSKSSKFSYYKISEFYDQWNKWTNDNEEVLTKRSIMYWAKIDNPEEYEKVRGESIDYFIEQAIETPTEVDCANILYHMRKDKYVCSNVKNNTWFEFRNHRWRELYQGVTLRNTISTELYGICVRKSITGMQKLNTIEQGTEEYAKQKKHNALISELCKKLKSTSFKNNIMRESQELFYDCNFIEKIDMNPYVLCFQNGIYDFDQKRFRNGNPDDYCMKCTNQLYVELDKNEHNKYIKEIEQFMHSLFPIKELEDYMWSHLASSLMGINKDHSFHIYTGSGSNGKSILTEFMTQCLGDYQEQVPITLITQKRNSIGGTSSEVARLHGVRYAVMQEPTKGDRINEGIMKEITGGDPITARHLFKDAFTFKPMFKLVVATNHLFDIKSNDDGTWRRIRVCDFKSKFKDKIDENDTSEPFQFKKDYNLDKKLKVWAPYFLSMLVEKCAKEQGVFPIADIVQARSNNYRNDQDYLSEFVAEKIQEQDGGRIKKTELYETFKQWYNEQYGKNVPKGKDLYTFMDKRFGKYATCWKNVEIKYDEEDGGYIQGI